MLYNCTHSQAQSLTMGVVEICAVAIVDCTDHRWRKPQNALATFIAKCGQSAMGNLKYRGINQR